MICVLDNYYLDPRPKVPIFPKDAVLSRDQLRIWKVETPMAYPGASLPQLLHGTASMAQSVLLANG